MNEFMKNIWHINTIRCLITISDICHTISTHFTKFIEIIAKKLGRGRGMLFKPIELDLVIPRSYRRSNLKKKIG